MSTNGGDGMRRLRLAYRDNDRTPVIYCIREMARRYYDIDVEVLRIPGTQEYEDALFNGSCDVIIEHLEYLYAYAEKPGAKKITMFSAPRLKRGLDLVVARNVKSLEEFKGKTLAVRGSGRPHSIMIWLRMMGLLKEVKMVIVGDDEVGRWGQWKKVASGECVATFMDPLYLPQALAGGLKVLPVPDLPVIGHYSQACLAKFGRDQGDLMSDYVKAVIHALCLMRFRKEDALSITAKEPMKLMKITDMQELERQFDCIVRDLEIRPYPTPEAMATTYEISQLEYGAKEINPFTLWDCHWTKDLDDQGFIDRLIKEMAPVKPS